MHHGCVARANDGGGEQRVVADVAKLSVGREAYYTRELATDHEQYLSGHGESPGRWYGAGADSLGLQGEASVAGFQAMFEGRHPNTGELLGRPHGRNAVPAFDVVLRPTKSVSILVGRVGDRLIDHFGEQRVFVDVDTIEPGVDFAEAIAAAVGSCQVLLALIGDRWLDSTDRKGRRKLDDANDLVRLEIQAALERNIRVIPVLVDGVAMPTAEELPPSLAGLARRHAFELSYSRFRDDARRLVGLLDRLLAGTPPGPATVSSQRQRLHAAEERPRTTREQSTVLRLVSARSIPDGTPLTLRPTTEVTPEVRAAIEAWVNPGPTAGPRPLVQRPPPAACLGV
jgi:hypothetical protein